VTGDPDRRRGERFPRTREAREESKVKGPTRKPDVLGTHIRIRIYRPGHPSRGGLGSFLPSLGCRTATKFTRSKEPTPSSNQSSNQNRDLFSHVIAPARNFSVETQLFWCTAALSAQQSLRIALEEKPKRTRPRRCG